MDTNTSQQGGNKKIGEADIFRTKEEDLNISSIEKPNYPSGKNNSSFIKNLSFRSNTNISFDKSIVNDIFKIVCPDLNMNIYNYSRRMVRQIKLMFRSFYDNRIAYLSEVKKQLHAEKKKNKVDNTTTNES